MLVPVGTIVHNKKSRLIIVDGRCGDVLCVNFHGVVGAARSTSKVLSKLRLESLKSFLLKNIGLYVSVKSKV